MTNRVGRYTLIKRLAAGGMGEVFIAELTGLSGFAKRVALKRIVGDLPRESTYVEMFLNEARLGSFLNHPNIVHIFDVGHEADTLWLVMEYVDGVDLRRLLRRSNVQGQRINEPVVAAIAIEVLNALEEAHTSGPLDHGPIIHRDISPENVMIARGGAVKVLDFGLAKWLPGHEQVPSKDGQKLFGKLPYMSPEQLCGQPIGPASDVYAVGIVLYEALRGELPFDGLTPHIVHKAILETRPPPPTALSETPQPDLDAIVLRAIATHPRDRFESAAAMRRELVRYLREYHLVLPLEQLRSLLEPGQPLSADVAAGGQQPSEIALTSAVHCGKCGGAFRGLFFDGLLLDRCSECRGVWLNPTEIRRILGRHELGLLARRTTTRAPLDGVVGSCPVDMVGLQPFNVPGQPVALEICPSCHGVWLDEGELQLLQQRDVVDWLRGLLGC